MGSDAKFFGIVGVVAVLVLAGIIFYSKSNKVEPKGVVRSELEVGVSKGSADAKVVIAEFSDFQCPSCGANYPIIKEVVAKNPDIKFVYRHFPLPSHNFGKLAAYASEAANKQGKFWEYHDKLFESQEQWSAGDAEKIFEDIAKSLSLDVNKFNSDRTSNEIKQLIQQELEYGSSIGISKTPTFFINGREVASGLSVEEWQIEIDKEKNAPTQ